MNNRHDASLQTKRFADRRHQAGTDVVVVEMLDEALTGFDDDLATPVVDRMESLGVEIHLGESASGWEKEGEKIAVTTKTEDGEETSYDCEKVLVAVGRKPVTDTLNLDSVGLEPDENGFLPIDDRARTDVEHVFAVGDVAGEPMLAHKGMKEGHVAAEVIAGEPAALDYQAVPMAVFTEPEIGTVGMTADEATEAGFEPVIGEMPFRASGRALTMGETDGFVRVIADGESGFVLGGQIVGPEASELIAEIGLAIELGATLEDVAATIAGYWSATPDAARILNGQNRAWNGPGGDAVNWLQPWSAAFISWVMCEAGLGDANQFERDVSHRVYVDQAIRARDGGAPQAAFVAYDAGEVQIEPGDLLCNARGQAPYRNLADRREERGRFAPTHCDVVVKVDAIGQRILVIGGNVEQSVSLTILPAVQEDGQHLRPVDQTMIDGARTVFAHLKLRADPVEANVLDNSPTIQALANLRAKTETAPDRQ
ncbi:MAG: DUF2272 domain-containing protein [Euryarchaeota archaeon]|nr:DUF2272 domain-containing protein [Euryarchaeota archaeon]